MVKKSRLIQVLGPDAWPQLSCTVENRRGSPNRDHRYSDHATSPPSDSSTQPSRGRSRDRLDVGTAAALGPGQHLAALDHPGHETDDHGHADEPGPGGERTGQAGQDARWSRSKARNAATADSRNRASPYTAP